MFMGPTWGPSGADRTQVGPMLAPWTLLSGMFFGKTWLCCSGTALCYNSTVQWGVSSSVLLLLFLVFVVWRWVTLSDGWQLLNATWHIRRRMARNHTRNAFMWCIMVCYMYLNVVFIRPFEKRDVLCRGNVRPSVCPSVCPSVRPSVRVFRTFLQHALRYQFETWYMHSVGGTTCRVWVASQLGQFDLVYSQK